MEIFWAIVISAGIIYGACWLIATYIGWTVVFFLMAALMSLPLFCIQGKDGKKTHGLDAAIALFIFSVWSLTTILYWLDILNPIHSFLTFLLLVSISFLPLLIAWMVFDGKPIFRFLLFFIAAGAGIYCLVVFPVFNNDYYRFYQFEWALRPTEMSMLAGEISDVPILPDYPVVILEKRERTPNEEVCYSGLNEKLSSSIQIATHREKIETIIFLYFYYEEYSSYVYTTRNVGSSSPSFTGDVQSYQHVCQIYIYSPQQDKKYLYTTINGAVPKKPTDSLNSWGERIKDKDVIASLKLLFDI